MKIQVLTLASLLMISTVVHADTPPVPGSKRTGKIESSAAQILFDSYSEPVQRLSPEYAFKTPCGVVNTGIVHRAKSTSGKVKIVCSAYYCMGHHAVCNLVEIYN